MIKSDQHIFQKPPKLFGSHFFARERSPWNRCKHRCLSFLKPLFILTRYQWFQGKSVTPRHTIEAWIIAKRSWLKVVIIWCSLQFDAICMDLPICRFATVLVTNLQTSPPVFCFLFVFFFCGGAFWRRSNSNFKHHLPSAQSGRNSFMSDW